MLNPPHTIDDERPRLVVRSPGVAFEWLRATAGTGRLDDLRHRHGRNVVVAPSRTPIKAEQLAALINSRYQVLDARLRPALFPVSAARRAIATPGELPNLADYHPQAVMQ
ncbi:hypothetical protein [Pseudonocardia hydrocarbonoxydans]|uniref:Uncharacterized protein n=1 Tax=Pseudonocardia hydrocarbonoxydans TaxID=76726 RepID=A0A4Y3WTC5_9PSEU|nr:hypothetical protein [Pseudonocardia hydrocarbonoxydans]GEC22132.1 hypothetical protein PHY01_44150 [Pseudonocardia hydrocarbonoxydans]